MKHIVAVFLLVWYSYTLGAKHDGCKWDSKRGAKFDLRSLHIHTDSDDTYAITDGDIPCTPEKEPAYGYAWNFCDDVPDSAIPQPCLDVGKSGAVLQYAKYSESDYYCFIIGHYNPRINDLSFKLLDHSDPTKGVSLRYPAGERCSATNSKLRTATIDVQCSNTKSIIVSAQEPDVCEYHLVMRSYHGCPKECPVTKHGLCDSHGHCAFDTKKKESYCYCNEGYSGSDCSDKESSSSKSEYDGLSVQLGLLITLLVLAFGLTGGMIYVSYKVTEFRKQQVSNNYNQLPGGETEMVDTVVTFRSIG